MTIRMLLIGAAMMSLSSTALAQSGSADEETACRSDVRRFCYKVKQEDGSNAYLQCLQAHRARLTERCRAVLESHGA